MFNSDGEEEVTELKINQNYAKRYDEWRNKEELQKLKDRYGDVAVNSGEEDESSTDESEDDDAKEWNDTMEKSFLATLSLIKSRSEKIYKEDEVIFKQPEVEESIKETKHKEKPVYLKDLEREMILDK
jgi:protein KRI1